MTSLEISSVIELVLDEGLDDWVALAVIRSHCLERAGKAGLDAEALTLLTIEALISGGLAQPGILGESGFEAWPMSEDEAISRLQHLARDPGWTDEHGYDIWFSNTPV